MIFSPASPSTTSAPSIPASTLDSTPWWGRIETVWLLLTPLCALLFALCLPLSPNDLWYHVRAGEFLVRLGHIPTENGMSVGIPLDAPYYYQSWISEWILFQTVRIGGLDGLQLLRAFCFVATFGLITWAAFRLTLRCVDISRVSAARIVTFAGIWCLFLVCNNADLRPQTFSVLLFGIWMSGLCEFDAASGRARLAWGAGLFGVMALWANTHGAFAVALISLAGWVIGKWLFARPRRDALPFAILWAACALAVCLNPRGASIYVYLKQLSQNTIGQKYIQEWQSPGFGGWHDILFWSSIVLAIGAVWLARRAQTSRENTFFAAPEIVPLLALALMGARDLRSVIWFALFLPLVIAPALAAMRARNRTEAAPVAAPRGAALINLVILLFIAALPVTFTPQLKSAWPWPKDFLTRFAPTPARVFPGDAPLLLDRATPVQAAEFLLKNPPRGRLFTDMAHGSYLAWATYPTIRPWCEPRVEMFPDAFWEDYVRLSDGPANVSSELKRRGFSDALLDTIIQKKLLNRLRKDPSWQVVARGGDTILLRQK